MSRFRKPALRRRPRRGAHVDDAICGRAIPPSAVGEEIFIAVCESLELWRVRAFEFDAYGPMPDGDVGELLEAIEQAAVALEDTQPAASAELRRLLDSLED